MQSVEVSALLLTPTLQVFHLFLAELLQPPGLGCPRAEAECTDLLEKRHVNELVWQWNSNGARHESVSLNEQETARCLWDQPTPFPVSGGQRTTAGLCIPDAAELYGAPRCPAAALPRVLQPGHCREGQQAARPGSP